MKNSIRKFTLWLALGVMASGASTAAAKDYAIPGIVVNAEIAPDGALEIAESITYAFDGSYSYAYRDIELTRGETLSDIEVWENGKRYEPSSDRRPYTFSVTATETGKRITWYYEAQNERRTFDLKFRLMGVVKRFADVGELYYQFVGGGWERGIGEVDVTLRLPSGVLRSQIQAWVHGPKLLNGDVVIHSDGTLSMDVSPLPRQTYWEGRVLFPADVLSDAVPFADTNRRDIVVAEETRWADDANRLRERRIAQVEAQRAERERLDKRALGLLPISILLALFAAAFWFFAFRNHGWPHRVHSHAVPGEIPSGHRPALVSYLVFKSVGGPAIVATLLDLANRGYFTIRETTHEKSSIFGTRTATDYQFERTKKLWDDMAPYELALAEFLITEVGDVTGFTMSGLSKTATKHSTRFQKWFRKWVKSVHETGKQMQFFEPYPKGAMLQNVAVGLIVALCGVFFCVYSHSQVGIPAIVVGAIVTVLTAALNRRTVEGRRLLLAWRAFKGHLESIAKGLGPVTLGSSEWSRYLGVAVIFGMHKKLLPKIQPVDDNGAVVWPVWYHATLGGHANGIASLADGLTTMVSSVSTTMSSASGTGGGASVGGGGGSGGGGGGAG